MIALNVYKNLCRTRLQSSVTASLTNLTNIVSNSKYADSSRLSSKSSILTQSRCFTDDSHTKPTIRLPTLSDFPVALWPQFLKTLRNFILVNMVVRPQFDNEFNMTEFITASKQAIKVVSNALSRQDYEQIEGLVTNDIIQSLRQKVSQLDDRQRELIPVDPDDIYMAFPFEVGIMNEGEEGQERTFVEITVVHHVLRGLQRMRQAGESPPLNMGMLPEYQEKIFVCNYRFQREYTKGVDAPWVINMVNHFMPVAL